MKLDDSRISSSDENGYTYIIGYNFLCFSVHIENIVPLVMFIEKFDVVLSFHNLKNVDINIHKDIFACLFSIHNSHLPCPMMGEVSLET